MSRSTRTASWRSPLRLLTLALAAAALGACADDEAAKYAEKPVHVLYNQAADTLDAGHNELAAKQFDEVERQHPYSVWATRAKLMAAYAHYAASDYDSAILALDRFIQLHPGNASAPYAFYLKGLSYYEQISDVARDQSMTEKAVAGFEELVRRFPATSYARDARLKLDLARDHLAGKEMLVGRFYQKQGYFLAAINRFRNVIETHQTTTHVPEALHRLVEAYTALGLTDAAQKYAAVLGHNYPGSPWYVDSFRLATGKDFVPPREGAANDSAGR